MNQLEKIAVASNLNLFTGHLGYKNARLQKTIYPYLQNPQVKRFIAILPPGHSKSTCCTVNYPCWDVGIDHNLRFIIVCHSDRLVRAFIRQIRYTLASEKYRAIFGNLKPTHEIVGKGGVRKWSETELLIRRSSKSKDPTFAGYSIGEHIVGGRADRIICDDMIDRDNVTTVEQRDKAWDWFTQELMTRLEPDGRVVVVGTRWHWDDLYSRLLEQPEYSPPLVLKAIQDDGTALWPEQWSLDALLERKRPSPIAFECQYQGNPTPTEGAELKREWLNYYDPEHEDHGKRLYRLPPRDRLRIFQAWDPAISESPEAAYTVGLTAGLDRADGGIYVLSIARGHWDFPTTMKNIEAEACAWKPEKIGIEAVGFQRMYAQGLQPKLLPLVDLKQTRKKEERIRSMSPHFENGRIRINRNMSDLIQEYLEFPKGRTVDILDTLEMVVRMIVEGAQDDRLPVVKFGSR